MKPIWAMLKRQTSGVTFLEVDGDKTRTRGIDGYPTIVANVNGTEFIYAGGATYVTLRRWVDLVKSYGSG